MWWLIYLYVFLVKEIRKIVRESGRNMTTWTIMSILFPGPIVTIYVLTCLEICNAMNKTKNEINKIKDYIEIEKKQEQE